MSEVNNLMDGKLVADAMRDEIKAEVDKRAKEGRRPGLAVIIVGDDPASHIYVNSKEKACEAAGILSLVKRLPEDITQEDLLAEVRAINEDDRYHGLLVQSPIPSHLDEEEVVRAIDPRKDVDGFHPYNMGLLALNQPRFVPCTPLGVMELLERYDVDPEGKHAVILGRSHLVGMPMALLLQRKAKGANATVTLCHSRTPNIADMTRRADILIAAIGKANFVKADMVKEDAVVIDVGINRVDDATKKKGYRIVGDVDFESVQPKAKLITPVPGGVGRMTIALLLKNTLYAEELLHKGARA